MVSTKQLQAEIVQKLKDETFPRYLGYFEALLADNSSTGFFVGDSVSSSIKHAVNDNGKV